MTAERKHILFVNDEMCMGGVAKVLNTLMRALPRDQYEIDLLIFHKRGMLLKEIPEDVHVIEGTPFFRGVDLSLQDLLKCGNLVEILLKLRLLFYMKTGLIRKRIVKERKKMLHCTYDVEVAAKEGFCTIFTACGDSKRKINWVLTDYSVCNYSSNHMPLVKRALQRIDLNVADSQQALIAYETVFHVRNGITIHNMMDLNTIKEGMLADASEIQQNEDIPNLITVARFHPQKGIDRLITACHDALLNGSRFHLYLIGGGECENMIREQVKAYNMEGNVTFLGYRQNPYALMAKADLFVLPSLYEGFATVINESLIAGTPVLSTDVSGASEQIIKPDYGWIVENSQEGLNQGLKKALCDFKRLKDMKRNLIYYRYPNEEILRQFIDIL